MRRPRSFFCHAVHFLCRSSYLNHAPPSPSRAPPPRSHIKAVQLAGGLQQNQVVIITQAPPQQVMYNSSA